MASPSLPPSPSAAATPVASGDQSPAPLSLPAPPTSTSSRRLPPPCWTHEETLALIEAYRDKWLSLRRGNLRAADWQDVADTVAIRCPDATPSKTPVQCRHKVEKLRKRFRAERQRAITNNRPVSWPYFPLLDAMEISGPNPTPTPKIPTPPSSTSSEEEDELDQRNTRSIHGLMSNGGTGGLRFTIPKASRSKGFNPNTSSNPNPDMFLKKRSRMEEMRMRMEKKRRYEREEMEEEEEDGGEEEGGDVFAEMAVAIRSFGEGFLRVERMKMEMAREMEKARMEMELKRTEMMLDAQRKMVDAFVKGYSGKKRAKASAED
ncbi:trihelix transcription factor ASIL2-like protein [Carex littledalei]|uniref:Trihelix transcription factor ASIL2-like protein n=1 Tax=Carex littledalei TaxID=544730 RepID=A0A833VXZ8_9POAL|nr:trihelix transcription factor ASIL2-like protein [Carex littledalei]